MRKLILFLTLVFASTLAMAQATSLVVDNQTPGWLSSKINYGDQKTVVNLKVTGYINQDDVTFINQLISKQKLHGKLDLEDADVVGGSGSFDEDSVMRNSGTGTYCVIRGTLKHLLLPKSLKRPTINIMATDYIYICDAVKADTITIGGKSMPNIPPQDIFGSYNDSLKCLIFREGVESVGVGSGQSFYQPRKLSQVVFPSTLKEIKTNAFKNCKKLMKVHFPDNITTIGSSAFANVPLFSDTVRLPKTMHLKEYDFNYFASNSTSSGYIKGQVVYLPDSIKTITQDGFKGIFELHLTNPIPPKLKGLSVSSDYTKSIHTYVPKSLVVKYQGDSEWSKTTIIVEPNPATAVKIANDSTRIKKNYTNTLTATITPNDADSKTVNWYSGDINIASVSAQGIVTAHNSGKTYIYVELADNPSIKDSCLVTVYQPVSGIQLNVAEKELKVGEYYDLSTTVSPSDADNKNVIWKSEDETIASVSNGRITAKKAGKVKITASSAEDSTINAVCNITVVQPVEGVALSQSTYTLNGIGETVQLNATVTPEDASNKTVNWKSSDEKVCIVSNGMVVAVGYGSAVIIAITADGGFMATCTVTVNNTTGIQNVHKTNTSIYRVFGIDGKEKPSLQKGINIIKFEDGSTRKVVIK